MLKAAVVYSKDKKTQVLEYLADSVIAYSENSRIVICDVSEEQQNYLESNGLAKLYEPQNPDNYQLMLCNKFGILSENQFNDNYDDPCNVPPIDSFYKIEQTFSTLSDPTNFKNLNATINLDYTGKNVDVVIVDDAPCPQDHPEFLSNDDNSGISRVHNIDWNRTDKYKANLNVGPFTYTHPVKAFDINNDNRHKYHPYYFYDNAAPQPATINDFFRKAAQKYDTHGIHVAGTACGNTQGWAKSSNVYFMEYTNTSSLYPDLWLTGEHLLNFHNNKPINPHTGRKNPTVANMSFGLMFNGIFTFLIETIHHRGQTYTMPMVYDNITTTLTAGSNIITLPSTEGIEAGNAVFKLSGAGELSLNQTDVTIIDVISPTQIQVAGNHALSGDITIKIMGWSSNQLIYNFGFLMEQVWVGFNSGKKLLPKIKSHGVDNPVMAAYIEDAIDAGVIIVASAGNTSMKVDAPGGLDWDNYWTATGSTYQNYYHRGSWPANVSGVITVGSMSANVQENKSYFSVSGPGVDIYAPGEGIQSSIKASMSPMVSYGKVYWNSVEEPRNSDHFLGRAWGTSMASPQVAGMAACYLEKEPNATPAQVKQWIIDNGKPVLYDTGGGYGDLYSLNEGTNKLAFFPYGSFNINSNTIQYPSSATTTYSVPASIANFDCSFAHCLLLTTNEDLYSWGYNNQGQLGNGNLGNLATPQKIGEGYVQVSAGLHHSLGLKSNGDLYAWGWNRDGQLGMDTNTVKNNSRVPILIGQGYVSIAAGENCSFGVKSNGDLYAWGYNKIVVNRSENTASSLLGDGTTTTAFTPIKIGEGYSKVVAGRKPFLTKNNSVFGQDTIFDTILNAGLKSNGDVYVWGQINTVGNNLVLSTPTKIGEGYQDISAGSSNLLLLKSNGEVYGYGHNIMREFGTGTEIDMSYITTPILIASDCAKIRAGNYQNYIIKTNGDLYGAGIGLFGDGFHRGILNAPGPLNVFTQIGNNTYSDIKSGYRHTLALDTNGYLYTWGINTVNELPINTKNTTILSPLQLS